VVAVKRAGNEPGGVALHESTCKQRRKRGSMYLMGLQRSYSRYARCCMDCPPLYNQTWVMLAILNENSKWQKFVV